MSIETQQPNLVAPPEVIWEPIFHDIFVAGQHGDVDKLPAFEPRDTPTGDALLKLFSDAVNRCVDRNAYSKVTRQQIVGTRGADNLAVVKERPAFIIFNPDSVVSAIQLHQGITPNLHEPFVRVSEVDDGSGKRRIDVKPLYIGPDGFILSKRSVLHQMAVELDSNNTARANSLNRERRRRRHI